MAKRIIGLVAAVLVMANVMAPTAEACFRMPPPPPRYVRGYRRPPRPHHHHHHHDRTGAVIAGVVIGAILASR